MVKITVEELERMAAETEAANGARCKACGNTAAWHKTGGAEICKSWKKRDAQFAAVLKRRNRRDAVHNS